MIRFRQHLRRSNQILLINIPKLSMRIFRLSLKKENNTAPVEPPIKTPEEIEKPKNAVLGFSYFPQIPLNEERDLRVFVKIEGDGKQVAKKLKAIEKEDLEFTKLMTAVLCVLSKI